MLGFVPSVLRTLLRMSPSFVTLIPFGGLRSAQHIALLAMFILALLGIALRKKMSRKNRCTQQLSLQPGTLEPNTHLTPLTSNNLLGSVPSPPTTSLPPTTSDMQLDSGGY